MEEGEENHIQLFEAREDATEALESAEEPFDFVAASCRGHDHIPTARCGWIAGGTTGIIPRSALSVVLTYGFVHQQEEAIGHWPKFLQQCPTQRSIVSIARRECEGYGRSGHSRQPDESWWSIRHETPITSFFNAPCHPGCTLTEVESSAKLRSDAYDLLQLQLFKHLVQHAVLCPAIHSHIDRIQLPNRLGSPRHLHPCSVTYRIAVPRLTVHQPTPFPLQCGSGLSLIFMYCSGVISIYPQGQVRDEHQKRRDPWPPLQFARYRSAPLII